MTLPKTGAEAYTLYSGSLEPISGFVVFGVSANDWTIKGV